MNQWTTNDIIKKIEQEIQKSPKKIRGANNGVFASGMYGIVMPASMNGPLGYINNPLPYKLELPTLLNGPKYNAVNRNLPAYVPQEIGAFNVQNFSSNAAPISDHDGILFINP